MAEGSTAGGGRITHGFLIGLGIGIVTAWLLYWRIIRLTTRLGFAKESVWRGVFSRSTYDGLVKMREHLDREIARRRAPTELPK